MDLGGQHSLLKRSDSTSSLNGSVLLCRVSSFDASTVELDWLLEGDDALSFEQDVDSARAAADPSTDPDIAELAALIDDGCCYGSCQLPEQAQHQEDHTPNAVPVAGMGATYLSSLQTQQPAQSAPVAAEPAIRSGTARNPLQPPSIITSRSAAFSNVNTVDQALVTPPSTQLTSRPCLTPATDAAAGFGSFNNNASYPAAQSIGPKTPSTCEYPAAATAASRGSGYSYFPAVVPAAAQGVAPPAVAGCGAYEGYCAAQQLVQPNAAAATFSTANASTESCQHSTSAVAKVSFMAMLQEDGYVAPATPGSHSMQHRSVQQGGSSMASGHTPAAAGTDAAGTYLGAAHMSPAGAASPLQYGFPLMNGLQHFPVGAAAGAAAAAVAGWMQFSTQQAAPGVTWHYGMGFPPLPGTTQYMSLAATRAAAGGFRPGMSGMTAGAGAVINKSKKRTARKALFDDDPCWEPGRRINLGNTMQYGVPQACGPPPAAQAGERPSEVCPSWDRPAKKSRASDSTDTDGSSGSNGGFRQPSSAFIGVSKKKAPSRLWEAHLWDKEGQRKPSKGSPRSKGVQKFLGSYETEVEAARAHDRGMLTFFGQHANTNLPKSDYAGEVELLAAAGRVAVIGQLKAHRDMLKRFVPTYPGVIPHQALPGKWEARVPTPCGKSFKYLGMFRSETEAAVAIMTMQK